jgi:hypothetical protein
VEERIAWPNRWMWIGAIATVIIIAPAALRWAFHDEVWLSGHISMAASIQNGPYPPRSLSIPALELRYHHGFSLLVAAVTSIFRMPIPLAIDLITLAAAGYLFMLLWLLGERLLGPGKGWLTALITFFGAGAPFACAYFTRDLAFSLLTFCGIDGVDINPPIVSYLFQHPWTLGLPITIILMHIAIDDAASRWRLPLIGTLLVALSLTQIVLFAATSASLVASEALSRGPSIRRGAAMLGVSAAAWLVAAQLGGFFVPAPAGAISLVFTPGILGRIIPTLAWNAGTFGLLLPFGLIGLARMGRLSVLLACFALGGLTIINVVRYTHSWDIVKFGAVASVGLSIAASAAVAKLLTLEPRRFARAVGALSLAFLTAGAFSFVAAFAFDVDGIPHDTFHKRPAAYTKDEGRAMSWLRREARPGEVVVRNSGDPLAFSQWAGLPQPWNDPMLERFGGAPPGQVERRERLIRYIPDDPAAFAGEGIVWFVIQPNGSRADTITDQWVKKGIAVERSRFGSLRIIELVEYGVDGHS